VGGAGGGGVSGARRAATLLGGVEGAAGKSGRERRGAAAARAAGARAPAAARAAGTNGSWRQPLQGRAAAAAPRRGPPATVCAGHRRIRSQFSMGNAPWRRVLRASRRRRRAGPPCPAGERRTWVLAASALRLLGARGARPPSRPVGGCSAGRCRCCGEEGGAAGGGGVSARGARGHPQPRRALDCPSRRCCSAAAAAAAGPCRSRARVRAANAASRLPRPHTRRPGQGRAPRRGVAHCHRRRPHRLRPPRARTCCLPDGSEGFLCA
jgi:hypothetical protein